MKRMATSTRPLLPLVWITIGKSDCASCHAINEKSIGPSYQAVAERYRKDQDAVKYLSGKIIALDKHKPNVPGRYYLQASYTDKGGADNTPRLTTKKVMVLRAPVLPADKFTEGKKVMAFHVSADDNPMGDDEMDLLVANGGGWVSYGDIDLRGIKTIKAQVALAPQMTAGGTITVRSGHPQTGKVVAEATLKQGISTYGVNDVMLAITDAPDDGPQPLYFSFTADSDAPDAVLGAVMTIEFMRGEVSK